RARPAVAGVLMTADRQDHAVPTGLRERVMTASRQARPAGLAVPEIAPDSPAEAFRSAADAFYHMLATLSAEDWHLPVLRDLGVEGLVGRLGGVERAVQRCSAGDEAVGSANHVESTQPVALAQAGRAPAATTAAWYEAIDGTLAMASVADLDASVAIHGVALR